MPMENDSGQNTAQHLAFAQNRKFMLYVLKCYSFFTPLARFNHFVLILNTFLPCYPVCSSCRHRKFQLYMYLYIYISTYYIFFSLHNFFGVECSLEPFFAAFSLAPFLQRDGNSLTSSIELLFFTAFPSYENIRCVYNARGASVLYVMAVLQTYASVEC